jgi:Zn-dependent protease with chaperone function
MGYLAHIVLALGAQALAAGGYALHGARPIFVLALVLVPYALGWIARTLFVRGRFRAGEQVYRVLHWSAPILYAAATCAFGWQESVRNWTGSASSFLAWPDWTVAILILPFVLYELVAIDARARITIPRGDQARWRAFQSRLFFSGLAPLCVYVLIATLIGLSDGLRIRIEEVRLWNALFALAMLGVLGLMLPFLLRNTWEMAPVPDGPEKDLLLSVAQMARFENPRLYVWKTGHTMANAAIVGLTRKSRVVLFSDSLLAQMGPSELAAVFAHEMGHAFRRHVPIFIVFVLAFVMMGDLVAEQIFPDEPFWAGATLLGVMGVWFLSFGWLSRRFELEADLFSLDLLGEVRSLISALEKVGGRLRDVAGWRHFSTAERVLFLERAEGDPDVGRRLRRDLRRFTWFGIVLFVVSGVLQAVRLVGAFPEDRVRAELCLGHYARAHDIAPKSGLDPHLAMLVDRAFETRHDASLERLAARALRAARSGDFDAAAQWVELGRLRGDEKLGQVAQLLDEPADERRLGAIVHLLEVRAGGAEPDSQ